jgi:RNA polymerase sigma factor (sigma-70 family)
MTSNARKMSVMEQPSAAHDRVSSSAESTLTLLTRARAGDRSALEILFTRYRPRLLRWAHRRLPAWARDLSETDDLVHDTLLKTFRNLDGFIPEHDRGFQHYLRLAIGNAVRDEIRKARTRPAITALDPSHPCDAPSPLERALGQHRLARYEAALERLSSEEREAVVARLEFGFTHRELADALGKSTPDAARKVCHRALARLLALMQERPTDAPQSVAGHV